YQQVGRQAGTEHARSVEESRQPGGLHPEARAEQEEREQGQRQGQLHPLPEEGDLAEGEPPQLQARGGPEGRGGVGTDQESQEMPVDEVGQSGQPRLTLVHETHPPVRGGSGARAARGRPGVPLPINRPSCPWPPPSPPCRGGPGPPRGSSCPPSPAGPRRSPFCPR